MTKLFFISCIFVFILHLNINGQCTVNKVPYKGGEVLNFQAFYNWGFIWIHAGDVQFRVNDKSYRSQPVFQLEATGNSLKSYDWLYKVRDKFQSFVDKETLQPYFFERNTQEGGYKAFEQYFFEYPQKKIYGTIENNDVPFRRDTLKLTSCTFDVISAVYFCRSMDFNHFKINDRIPITTLIDNKVYNLYFRYLGKEVIESKDKKKYRCFKFSALMVEGTIFKGGEDINVWVTDDDNRVPILVEAKILVGSVKAYFSGASNLKYPLNSLVK
jgi:hypothetical protein